MTLRSAAIGMALGALPACGSAPTTSEPPPSIVSIEPRQIVAGLEAEIRVLGSFTHWREGETVVDVGDVLEPVGEPRVAGPEQMALTVRAPAGASPGRVDLVIASGDERVSGLAAIEIVPRVRVTSRPFRQGALDYFDVEGRETSWLPSLYYSSEAGVAGFYNLFLEGPTRASFFLQADLYAAPGPYDVVLHDRGVDHLLDGGFAIEESAIVPLANGVPSAIRQLADADDFGRFRIDGGTAGGTVRVQVTGEFPPQPGYGGSTWYGHPRVFLYQAPDGVPFATGWLPCQTFALPADGAVDLTLFDGSAMIDRMLRGPRPALSWPVVYPIDYGVTVTLAAGPLACP